MPLSFSVFVCASEFEDDDDCDDDHVEADDDGDADDPLHLEAPAAAAGFLHHCLVMRLPCQFRSILNSFFAG